MADSDNPQLPPQSGDFDIPSGAETETTAPPNQARGTHAESDSLVFRYGDRIGRYHVERVLGSGGFGIVVLAMDTVLQRKVAIKMSRSLGLSARIKASLIEEARAAASLDHPNIVRVYDVDEWEGRSYVVMELVEGRSLAEEIARGHPISIHRFVVIMKQVVLAMEQLHSRGIIHRDLKPANVLLGENDHVKVTDLGLALNDGSPQWKEKSIAGTRQYMAPEQVLGEVHRIDGRTDIWAFGIIAYELLTLRSPFRTNDDTSIFSQILKGELASPKQRRPDIPDSIELLCLRCLSMRMADRFQSARQLMVALDSVGNETKESDATKFESDGIVSSPSVPVGDRTSSLNSNLVLNKERKSSEKQSADHQDFRGLIPRGLRSFSVEDYEYYRRLMPGPYDLDKRPSILNFWIKWVEATREPQSVGVLYGPSGCGKSSFLKAALLPSLSEFVHPIYFDFTTRNPIDGLIQVLHSQFPETGDKNEFASVLATIRDQERKQKLLLVLDQFEQYLINTNIDLEHDMVQALRQCDGIGVQAIILVRDEYWTEISQFMRMMETTLSDSVNAMSFPLMNKVHAKKVLEAFGRAFEMLPPFGVALSESQQNFCTSAIESLSEEGTVLPVRIALFAELMKHYPWEVKTIAVLGGIDGALARYLSNMFDSKTSPMSRRSVSAACKEILRALLPQDDLDLKSASCSSQTLATLLGSAPIEQAISCLENDLHLITLISSNGNEKQYCLVHDYLVSPIRSWLATYDNLTWRGRLRQELNKQAIRFKRDPRSSNLLSPSNWLLGKCFVHRSQMSDDIRVLLNASRNKAIFWSLIYFLGVGTFVGMFAGLRYEFVKLKEQKQAQVNDGVYLFLNAKQDLEEPLKKILLDKGLATKSVESLVSIEAPSQKNRRTLLKSILDADLSMDAINESVSASNTEELGYWKMHLSKRRARDLAIAYFDSTKNEKPSLEWQYLFAACHDYRLLNRLSSIEESPVETYKFIAFIADMDQSGNGNQFFATMLAKELVLDYEASTKRDDSLMILAIYLLGLNDNQEVAKSVSEFAKTHATSQLRSVAMPCQWMLAKLNDARAHPFTSGNPTEWRIDEPEPGLKFSMIRVTKGDAVRDDKKLQADTVMTSIAVSEDLWLAREEVNEKLVSEFFNEQPEYRPNGWPENPNENYAARQLEASTILRFCNWLSSKASLKAVYAFEQQDGYDATNLASVFVSIDADGYRLPSYDEFRYAGIAGDFQSFKASMESKSFRQLMSPSKELAKQLETWRIFPNAWGFQGISGNRFEIVLNNKLEFCFSTFDAKNLQSLDLAIPLQDSASFQIPNGGFRLARTISNNP